MLQIHLPLLNTSILTCFSTCVEFCLRCSYGISSIYVLRNFSIDSLAYLSSYVLLEAAQIFTTSLCETSILQKTYQAMDPAHCDARNMLFDVLFVLRLLDGFLLLAHLADRTGWFLLGLLYKLLLHAIFLDEKVFFEVYYKGA